VEVIMDMKWTAFVQQQGSSVRVPLATLQRPLETATPSDFELSICEGRELLGALQSVVAQDQIVAYDLQHRRSRHCGSYRRIKDWRGGVFPTGFGGIQVRVPRFISCLCTPEPLDDDDEPVDLRFSECPIEPLLSARRTPKLTYRCAKHGACSSYRTAARAVADLAGLTALSHLSVRKETITCGEHIEDAQFSAGWNAGARKLNGAKHLRLSIDGTVLTAAPWQDVSRFEVIAGRVERNGHMGRRFVCALPRRTLARVLIAVALEQSGWTPSTQVDVVTDGAIGMRSLVTSVAPRVAPKILDWSHLGMKLHAVKTSIFARTYYRIDRPLFMTRCERLWKKIRNALWRGKADAAIEMTRTLVASLREEVDVLPNVYRPCAVTAHGAATGLLGFLINNKQDLVDYRASG
jgi:hypothetical protein